VFNEPWGPVALTAVNIIRQIMIKRYFESACLGMGKMRCPSCKSENPPDMGFCGSCGARLINPCPKCAFENPSGFIFCGRCGSSLSDARSAQTDHHRGDSGAAVADFREAISLAQKMGAKAWELRAATGLARLLRDNNRRDEARAMLADIYGLFTEGFDTADLKDAKALLNELSQ
jgi:hypothetical protein